MIINSISSHALPVLALLVVFIFQIFHPSLKKLGCGIKTTQKSHTFWNRFRSKQPTNCFVFKQSQSSKPKKIKIKIKIKERKNTKRIETKLNMTKSIKKNSSILIYFPLFSKQPNRAYKEEIRLRKFTEQWVQ